MPKFLKCQRVMKQFSVAFSSTKNKQNKNDLCLISQRNKAAMHELTVGQKVICKHKNGRYYQCDVVQLSKETFYEVNFDDGSFSDNLFPEDIVVRF